MDDFNGILDTFYDEDLQMIFDKGKPVKMIKDFGGEFNDYSISSKIKQTLCNWSNEFGL